MVFSSIRGPFSFAPFSQYPSQSFPYIPVHFFPIGLGLLAPLKYSYQPFITRFTLAIISFMLFPLSLGVASRIPALTFASLLRRGHLRPFTNRYPKNSNASPPPAFTIRVFSGGRVSPLLLVHSLTLSSAACAVHAWCEQKRKTGEWSWKGFGMGRLRRQGRLAEAEDRALRGRNLSVDFSQIHGQSGCPLFAGRQPG